ncbi:WD40 repeat domain-containing protein [Vairimorpha necatrix]|uniref:WD40 repeat domain-containing protein n=1 Tax=Vairimorpha necatrix TaxID=6039 RepID=A0AAX4JAM5_9MICR
MKAPVFPIFTLKTYENFVIVAGGGGEEKDGKNNGIIILNDTTSKDIAFYGTEDMILDLFISKGYISLELDNNDKTKDNSFSKVDNSFSKVDKVFPVHFAARGTNFIYLCKFDKKSINLLFKIEKPADRLIFKRHLIFIENKKIYTIFDALKNTKISSKKNIKLKNTLRDETQEEYVYALKKSANKILIEREEGLTDVPDTWENFFIVDNRIHKVCIEDSKSCFVFNGKKYFYDLEIGDISCLKDETLVFYLKGENSQLIFIKENEVSYKIPRITCMNVDQEDFVTIGTAQGKGFLFKNMQLFCTRKLCDLPLTGISYEKGYFYYSSFSGLVNRKKAFSLFKMMIFISFIIILLIGILIKLMKLIKIN